jgi:hypothetical protein
MTDQTVPDEKILAAQASAAAAQIPQVIVYGHSTLFYWWPAWAFGFIFAFLENVVLDPADDRAASGVGLSYVALLLLLIIFTNIRLRGIYSVVTLLGLAFLIVSFAWLGWWDRIAKILPYLEVRMNSGFYLVFSTALLVIWLIMFFIFDRLTYWRIRPGQMTIEHLVGGGAESFDANALRFQKMSSDLFRAGIGLGTGDLQVVGIGPTPMTMTNVPFAERKVRAIERLISVKPDFVA